MKVFLHIGWHKTGTTALQVFLVRNRLRLAEKSGMVYPECAVHSFAHHKAAWSLHDPPRSLWAKQVGFSASAEQLFDAVFKESAALGGKSVILSTEEFCGLSDKEMGRLARILDGHDVTVIGYVRRQDQFVESLYNMEVKFHVRRSTAPLEQFVKNSMTQNFLEYDRQARRWAKAFPRARTVFRVYDRERLAGGDIRRDFCQLIGVPSVDDLVFDKGDPNESLAAESVFFLQRLNSVPLTGEQHQLVVNILREYEVAKDLRDRSLLDLGQRIAILGRYQASNKVFLDEWVQDPDAFNLSFADLVKYASAPKSLSEQRFLEMLAYVLPRLIRRSAGKAPAAMAGAQGAPKAD